MLTVADNADSISKCNDAKDDRDIDNNENKRVLLNRSEQMYYIYVIMYYVCVTYNM